MEQIDVDYVLYVYYLDDGNMKMCEKITCDSPIHAQEIIKMIGKDGMVVVVDSHEYKYAFGFIKRHIPYHRVLSIDYIILYRN
jgi:hypothetical protein